MDTSNASRKKTGGVILMKCKETAKEILIITFGMMIASAAVYFFLIPGKLVIGSIAGLALVISQLVPLPISVITLILNVILLVLGYSMAGKEFGVKTVYTSMLLSVYLFLFEKIIPLQGSIMGDPWLDLLCFVLLIGLSQAILFSRNASSGGLDIIAKLLNKYFHMDLGKAVTMSGVVTSLTAVFVYDLKTVILGLLGTYINGLVLDHFIVGFNARKRVCIISDKYEEIQQFIVQTLERGVTLYPIYGGYQNEKRIELETILTRDEFVTLLEYLKNIDMHAFVTAGNVSEIYGNWNTKPRRPGKGRKD